MNIIISYPSAAEFWMSSRNAAFAGSLFEHSRSDSFCPDTGQYYIADDAAQWLIEKYGLSVPLHMLVPSAHCRKRSKVFVCNVVGQKLSETALLKLETISKKQPGATNQKEIMHTVFIASPELCFLQAAKSMKFLQLIKFGFDLCSIYVDNSQDRYSHTSRKAITDQSKIERFIRAVSNVKGSKLARKAVPYVLDQSNSPMETKIAMMTILPISYGGFGIKRPKLNLSVMLSEQGQKILGRSSCICDMGWLEEKVIVEYDSNLSHLDPQQHARDKARISALSVSGYTVICITAESIRLANLDVSFFAVRKALKMHSRRAELEAAKELRMKTWSMIMKL